MADRIMVINFWRLVSEPGKTGADVTFGHFRAEIKAFEEIGREKEISGRDLDGGGNVVARKTEI